MVNRDKLRNMSNIALADWLMNTSTCKCCVYNNLDDCTIECATCAEGVKKWLAQPCEGSNNGQNAPTVNNKVDIINKPSHYVKNGMECIDFIKVITGDLAPYEAYCLGNVIKYLWRFKAKNGITDLDKAIRYIEFLKSAQKDN